MSTFKNPICGDWNRRTIKSRREKKQTLWRRTERAKASFIVTLIRDAWLCVEMMMRCNLYYFFGSPEHWRRRDCHLRCSLRRSSRRALCASKHLWVGQTGVETVWVGCKQKPGAISSHFNWKLLPVRRILQKAFISIESYCRSVVFWGRIPGGLPPSCWDTSPGFQSGWFQVNFTDRTMWGWWAFKSVTPKSKPTGGSRTISQSRIFTSWWEDTITWKCHEKYIKRKWMWPSPLCQGGKPPGIVGSIVFSQKPAPSTATERFKHINTKLSFHLFEMVRARNRSPATLWLDCN